MRLRSLPWRTGRPDAHRAALCGFESTHSYRTQVPAEPPSRVVVGVMLLRNILAVDELVLRLSPACAQKGCYAHFYDRLYGQLCRDVRCALVRAWTYSTLTLCRAPCCCRVSNSRHGDYIRNSRLSVELDSHTQRSEPWAKWRSYCWRLLSCSSEVLLKLKVNWN